MNLIVDAGNTVLKAAVADGTTLGKTYRYQGEKKIEYVCNLAAEILPSTMVFCSARVLMQEEIDVLQKSCSCRLIIMDPSRNGIQEKHGIPSFITPDMTASMIAARHMFKDRAVSVFDFGTTLTSVFMTRKGEYIGSTVSPGCTTRFRSISRYARNLPLLRETDETQAVGNNLETSIISGVISGIIFEIEGFISLYPENTIVFTGGDANYFAKRTKNPIFVVCNLVLLGLALIADAE